MSFARRIGALVLAVLAATPADALEPATDLAADGVVAGRRGVPILLVMTREDCHFCGALKREILEPLRLSGDAPRRVLIREVEVDSPDPIVGFDGAAGSGWSIAEGYEALFTPTVLLVGPDGRELADRIVGLNTPEMYGWYLDREIDRAAAALGGGGGRPAGAGGGGSH